MTRLASDPVVPVSAVDPAWLTAVLRGGGHLTSGQVASVDAERFGTGQVADSYRFTISYEDGGDGPASLVGKFPAASDASRAFGESSGLYECEIRFYSEIAPTIPVTVPTPVHAAIDGEKRFVLLLEDLAPARVVDQIDGGTADELALAVEQLALLHAGSWGQTAYLDQPWLRTIVQGYQAVVADLGAVADQFAETLGEVIPGEDLAELRRLVSLKDLWQRELAVERCLWHQDFRLDNLLFDARDGAVPLAVVDWQTLGMGNGVIDLSQLLGTGLTTADRRAHERELVRLYHDALRAGGVEGYDLETCWDDYCVLAAHGLTSVAVGAATVQRTERGDRMWQAWMQRQAAQARDLGTMDRLAARHGA